MQDKLITTKNEDLNKYMPEIFNVSLFGHQALADIFWICLVENYGKNLDKIIVKYFDAN